MSKKKSKNQEYDQFNEIAADWWNPRGKFKIIHKILPLRIQYILNNIGRKNLNNLEILDLGCGGGLTCEPLSRLGSKVTGLDFVEKNIKIAIDHASKSNLKINYIYGDLDSIVIKKKYDVILMLEVLEHLDNWEDIIRNIKKNLKPKGKIIISTINKTLMAKFFAIFMAENFLKWVPKQTHDYKKLIKPIDLKITLEKNNFKFIDLKGMNFNPLTREWKLSETYFDINFICTAELN